MNLTIEINDLPFLPLNRAKMIVGKPRPMLIKTALCREFEKDLEGRLAEYGKHTIEDDEYIEVVYNLFCPRSEFFTKEGKLSSRCPDADSIKVLQDVIFRSIGIDDKHIKELKVYMMPSDDETWKYRILILSYKLGHLYV